MTEHSLVCPICSILSISYVLITDHLSIWRLQVKNGYTRFPTKDDNYLRSNFHLTYFPVHRHFIESHCCTINWYLGIFAIKNQSTSTHIVLMESTSTVFIFWFASCSKQNTLARKMWDLSATWTILCPCIFFYQYKYYQEKCETVTVTASKIIMESSH